MIHRFEEFQTSIQQVYIELQKLKTVAMQEFDLQASHVMCLYELDRHTDGMTAAELAAACDVDKAAISRSIKTLKDKGYVTDSTAFGDSPYRARIGLTETGRDVAERLNNKIISVTQIVEEEFDIPELDHLYSMLRRISDILKAAANLPGIIISQ